MATGSTASSGTDPQDSQDETEAAERPDRPDSGGGAAVHDPARRAFFFQFGKQAATAVGQVAGMADAVGRTSSALASELLGLDEDQTRRQPEFVRAGAAADPVVSAAEPSAEHAYRSAYRLSDEGLVILDQRRIPESLDEVVARRGSDVAYYLRLGVARGGPLMAQVAAYGLALTAVERRDAGPDALRTELHRTRLALTEARPSARLPAWALARQWAALEALPEPATGSDMATALRAEADAIATEVTAGQAAIAGALTELLASMRDASTTDDVRPVDDRPLTVLLHGSQGALAGGQVGAAISALSSLAETGHPARVFLTEGRPFMDGARLAAWELRQAGLEFRLVPDAAVAWLLAREPLDAILIAAEWVAANGDTGALVGSRALGLLAASQPPSSRPRVVIHGLAAVRDPDTPDGAAIPTELRPARELTADLHDVPVRVPDALVPAADVLPVHAIDIFVTERGHTPIGAG